MLMERSKLIVEGAGAAALSAVLEKKIKVKGKKIGVLISGGNIDINLISMIIEKGLIKSGRRVEIKTVLRDKPGQLRDLADLLAKAKVNILSIQQNRDRADLALGFVEADMIIETRDREHSEDLLKMMHNKGYSVYK
jgi:threonine dehydratase